MKEREGKRWQGSIRDDNVSAGRDAAIADQSYQCRIYCFDSRHPLLLRPSISALPSCPAPHHHHGRRRRFDAAASLPKRQQHTGRLVGVEFVARATDDAVSALRVLMMMLSSS